MPIANSSFSTGASAGSLMSMPAVELRELAGGVETLGVGETIESLMSFRGGMIDCAGGG